MREIGWYGLFPSEAVWYVARAKDGGFIVVTSARAITLTSTGGFRSMLVTMS